MAVNRRYLAVAGNAADMRSWAGIPYHFYQAGQRAGFFTGALDLHLERLQWHRLRWNLLRVLTGQGKGGYQFSEAFLSRAFRLVESELEGAEVISHFQLFPPPQAIAKRVVSNYYIDVPLRHYFEEYGMEHTVGRGIIRDAVGREKEGYARARRVICMSSWGARCVAEYGIVPEKIHTILPGANMDDGTVEKVTSELDEQPITATFDTARPFRLGFVGKDYRRKGLYTLVEATHILRSKGKAIEVVIVGNAGEELRKDPAVRWLGYIDKRTELERFVQAIAATDLGCLLSSAEGLGISTLEFLRVGVPVLGADVGGITDCVPPLAGRLMPKAAPAEQVAAVLQEYLDSPAKYHAMRSAARRMRQHYRWDRTVQQFQQLWQSQP